MKKNYERKILNSKALDVDTSKRQVKIAFAKVEDLDRDQEIFSSTAFNKSIKENGPQGTNEIWHLLDHHANSFSALSKFKEVGMDGQHLYCVSQYKDSFAWREVAWPLYESGDLTQHSIGFTSMDDEKSAQGYRVIKEARIWEGSAVLYAANPNTPVLQLIKAEFDEELSQDDLIYLRFDRVIKRLREDKFSENNKSLLLIELLQLQNYFINQSQQKATKQTISQDVIEAIKEFCGELN